MSTPFRVPFAPMLRFAVGWFELEVKTKALKIAQLTTKLQFLKNDRVQVGSRVLALSESYGAAFRAVIDRHQPEAGQVL